MMQSGQAGRQQAQQAQQAAMQAELQAQQARYQHERYQQRRRRRQAGHPSPLVPGGTERAASPSVSWPQASARRRYTKRAAAWGIAVVVVFWLIAITTHVEWVRQHDGTITPISYALAVVISVLVAGFLLVFYVLRARQPEESVVNQGGANMAQLKNTFNSGVGQADGSDVSPDGGGPRATAGGETLQYRTPGPGEIAWGGRPSLLVLSGTGQQRRIPIPSGGLVLGRRDQLGPPFSTDELVSREHASIRRYDDGSIEAADLGSTNGTYVNGRQIHAPTRMSSADVLRVGQIELRLELDADAAVSRYDAVIGSAVKTPAEEQTLKSAKAAYANREFQASAESFKKLVNSPAYAADAYYGLGMVALAQGRRQEADKLFGACLHADRTHANAWYQLGQLRESQSPTEALKFYREALRFNPQHAGAMRKLGHDRSAGLAQSAGVPRPPGAPAAPTPLGVAADASLGTGEAGRQFADAPSGHIRGRVVGFQRRAEQSFFLHRLYLYVWDFRVERPGMAPVMIEMRGFRFRGDISNGDIVDIITRDASPGQVLKVRRLLNLTTNAELTTSYGRGPRTLATAAKIAVVLIVLAVVIGIAALIIHSANG
jgi:tetratricopeptide (TPR) repeat protein